MTHTSTGHGHQRTHKPRLAAAFGFAASLATVLASGACQAAGTAGAAGGVMPAQWPAYTRQFDQLLDQDEIVGGGIVLVRDGRILAHHEHGLADRAQGVPISPNTIYHYGSITKTLTAIAIMQLRDRGRLTLDDPITRWVPELRQVHDPFGPVDAVTLRMLMSHSAGFQDPTWPYKQGKPWEPFEPTTWNQLVAMMPYQEIAFEPGSRYSYSNPGFIYLARVIEALTGDPWESYVQKNIFAPLGMTRSYFRATPYYLAADRSHNYTRLREASGREVVADNGADFDPGITIPNGGWNAPLTDLALYMAFLTDASHGDAATQRLYDTVLQRSSLTEMWQPLYKVGQDGSEIPEDDVGLSFFTVRHGATTFVGHAGNQAGFRAFLFLNPRTGAGVIAAVNTDSDLPARSRPTPYQQVRDLALDLIQ
jgi:CubicO group peptidase (beta-lactamase class C family)